MISTNDLISKFSHALENKWGYIWGTAGEKWTAAKQKTLEKTTDADRAQGRQYGAKWIGHTVADCSGLFTWAFRQLGGTMYHGSDTMYRKYCAAKGELKAGKRSDNGALKPGTAVFVWNGSKYSHVGLFIGNGIVIEAMNTVTGVTTTKVTAGKWTHWGELAGVDYSNAGGGDGGKTPAGSPAKAALKRGSKGPEVKALQEALEKLGYSVGACGVDGDFGRDTEAAVKRFQRDHGLAADGAAGEKTFAALEEASGGVSAKSYTVTISGLDLTQARAIAANYPACSAISEGR